MLNYRRIVQAGVCDVTDLAYPSPPSNVWKWNSKILPGNQWPYIMNHVCEATPSLVVYNLTSLHAS